jgi:hypothetical protein
MKFPRIGMYSSVDGDGRKYLKADGSLDQQRIDDAAQWSDLILDLGCVEAHPQIRAALKAANPGIRLHAYVVMGTWHNPNGPRFFVEFERLVLETNGVMLGANGKPWYFTNVNCARIETMDAIADLILSYSMPWDAIFIDVLMPYHGGDGADIGWVQMGYASWPEFQQAWQDGANHLVERLKASGHPVTTNYGNGFPLVANGCMREDFPHQFGNPATWETNMVAWGPQEGLIPLVFAEPEGSWICTAPAGDGHGSYNPKDKENERRQRLHDGSACLCGGFGTFGRYEGEDEWREMREKFFAPHYRHPQLGAGWLGEPLAPAYHVTYSGAKAVDLWVREFQYGIVIVNPSGVSHSIYLSRRYRAINGPVKDAFSIPPRDAALLEAV